MSMFVSAGLSAQPVKQDGPLFRFAEIPVLPDPVGFAGMFAGVAGESMVAAGGHRFADGVPWWDGGVKVWSDAIFIYSFRTKSWRVASQTLARPVGDGVSASYNGEIVFAGGGDAHRAYADVVSLRNVEGHLRIDSLPPMPRPCLRMGGALVGSILYIVAGRDHPTQGPSLQTFWAMDLAEQPAARRWKSLPPWPGPARMMPIVASAQGCLLVVGGIEVVVDNQGRALNRAPYLRDAYRYRPGAGDSAGAWESLPSTPHPVAGAPSPAWTPRASQVVIFGGVDGTIEPIADRSSVRALPDGILSLDLATKTWSSLGRMPPATTRVNAPAVTWNGGYFIVSGEHLPARRTNAVTRIERAAGSDVTK